MPTEINWSQLAQENEIAFLHADICIGSPESYSLDEMRQICENIDATNAAIDEAMRKDFESLPGFAKTRLHDMLGAPGSSERDWWERILLDFDSIPDAPPRRARTSYGPSIGCGHNVAPAPAPI